MNRRVRAAIAVALLVLMFALAGWRSAGPMVYHVGTGQRYASIGAVPWSSLMPGDIIIVHAGVYREHVVMTRSGTPTAPITVMAAAGEEVIIDGIDATTNPQFQFYKPYDQATLPGLALWLVYDVKHYAVPVSDIIIRGFKFRNQYRGSDANPNHFYDSAGVRREIPWSTSTIHMMCTQRITIEDCEITDSGNGIFAADSQANKDLHVTRTRITNCSNPPYPFVPSSVNTTHGMYTTCPGLILTDCYIKTRDGSLGADVKSRADSIIMQGCTLGPATVNLNLCEVQGSFPNTLNDPRHGLTRIAGSTFLQDSSRPGGVGPFVTFEHEYLLVWTAMKSDSTAGSNIITVDANPAIGTMLTFPGGGMKKVVALKWDYTTRIGIVTLDSALSETHTAGEMLKTDNRETCVALEIDGCRFDAKSDFSKANSLDFVRMGSRNPNIQDPMTNAQSVKVSNTALSVAPATVGALPSRICSTVTQGVMTYLSGNTAWPARPLDHRPNRVTISVVNGQSGIVIAQPIPVSGSAQ